MLGGFLNSDMKTIENGDTKFAKYSGQDFSELPLLLFKLQRTIVFISLK